MLKRIAVAVTAAATLLLATAQPARADEKFLGKVTKIEAAGKAALVTLQDEAGKSVVLTVEDKVTLDKFADKRIQVGDEIKAKYEAKGGKNVATYFKKPGGC
jgi:lysyl-tRNA synthetase class II